MTNERFVQLANLACRSEREGRVIDARRGDIGWEILRAHPYGGDGEWVYCSAWVEQLVYQLAAMDRRTEDDEVKLDHERGRK